MNKLKRVCGLDVHKDTIFACIKGGRYQSEVKEFTTMTEGLTELQHWLQGEKVNRVAMESTGIYWVPVWRALENHFNLLLVNPYLIKQMPGRKSDVKDAQWIATLLDKGLLKESIVPEETIRILRNYLRRYVHLQGQRTKCLQQIERHLSICNIKIGSLSSTLGSQTVLRVVESICSGKYNPDDLMEFVHGRIRNKHGKSRVRASLTGIIKEHDIFLLQQIYDDYNHIEKQCDALLERAEKLALEHYQKQLELLQTMPGVKLLSAIIILAELGGDITRFSSAEQLVGWCGLRPRNDESAGKIKSRSITNGNKYLRRIMVQVAWAATHTKGCYLKSKFEQLSLRKSSKKALIAIARKDLVIVWNILSKNEQYKEPVITLSAEKINQRKKYYANKLYELSLAQEKAGYLYGGNASE